MPDFPVHVGFPGRLVFVGFGSIGQGVLPLVLRHIGIKPERITIVTADELGKGEAAARRELMELRGDAVEVDV